MQMYGRDIMHVICTTRSPSEWEPMENLNSYEFSNIQTQTKTFRLELPGEDRTTIPLQLDAGGQRQTSHTALLTASLRCNPTSKGHPRGSPLIERTDPSTTEGGSH